MSKDDEVSQVLSEARVNQSVNVARLHTQPYHTRSTNAGTQLMPVGFDVLN